MSEMMGTWILQIIYMEIWVKIVMEIKFIKIHTNVKLNEIIM